MTSFTLRPDYQILKEVLVLFPSTIEMRRKQHIFLSKNTSLKEQIKKIRSKMWLCVV